MLKDRRVLVEQEIAKLKTKCSTLYGTIVFSGTASIPQCLKQLEYDATLQELTTRLTELLVINEMIENGHQ